MVTFEQANIMMVISAVPITSKKEVLGFIREYVNVNGVTINPAIFSSTVDGLCTAGYLTSTKSLPAQYMLTNAGKEALREFNEMVAAYRDLERTLW